MANYSRIFTDLLPNVPNKAGKIFKILKLLFLKPNFIKIKDYVIKKESALKKIKKPFKQYLLLTLVICSVFLLLILARMQSLNLEAIKARVEAEKQALYWEDIIKKHSDYPDAYYQAAWYSYTLGKKQKAYEFVNQAIALDPGFKKAIELKEKLLK